MQFESKPFIPKSDRKFFPTPKRIWDSFHWVSVYSQNLLNTTKGTRSWNLIDMYYMIRGMWFHYMNGQNDVGKMHCSCIGAIITRLKTGMYYSTVEPARLGSEFEFSLFVLIHFQSTTPKRCPQWEGVSWSKGWRDRGNISMGKQQNTQLQ